MPCTATGVRSDSLPTRRSHAPPAMFTPGDAWRGCRAPGAPRVRRPHARVVRMPPAVRDTRRPVHHVRGESLTARSDGQWRNRGNRRSTGPTCAGLPQSPSPAQRYSVATAHPQRLPPSPPWHLPVANQPVVAPANVDEPRVRLAQDVDPRGRTTGYPSRPCGAGSHSFGDAPVRLSPWTRSASRPRSPGPHDGMAWTPRP